MTNLRIVLALILSSLALASLSAQVVKSDDMRNCPMHAQHTADSHHSTVEEHGDQAMGFSHETTTHHFRMATDGGAIEVTANDPADKASTEAIRTHLAHISGLFAKGDFSDPMFIHDSLPPGVTTMKILKNKIGYQYEEIPSGGRVRIRSGDEVAVAGIHDFLRFQIAEHQTGDSVDNPH